VNGTDGRAARATQPGSVITLEIAPMKFCTPLKAKAALAAALSLAAATSLSSSTLVAAEGDTPPPATQPTTPPPRPEIYRQEPSPYPLPDAWYLDFKHAKPKRIVVDVPGQTAPTAYWYLTYTVTNNTGKEQEYYPEFEMVTQDGKIHRSSKGILRPVFDAIKKTENNNLLLPVSQMVGTLHQGEDQAKDGVAIWEEPMARMGPFSIYAMGLNGEFVTAADKEGKPLLDRSGATMTLRKTLEMNYVIWGDEIKPGDDIVQVKKQRWLMR
jgi:hypothetical protein